MIIFHFLPLSYKFFHKVIHSIILLPTGSGFRGYGPSVLSLPRPPAAGPSRSRAAGGYAPGTHIPSGSIEGREMEVIMLQRFMKSKDLYIRNIHLTAHSNPIGLARGTGIITRRMVVSEIWLLL